MYWSNPELIGQDGQRGILFGAIIDQQIWTSAFADRLSRHVHRLSAHLRILLHKPGIRLRLFLRGLIRDLLEA